MMNRRSFLKRLALIGGLWVANPIKLIEVYEPKVFYSFPPVKTFSMEEFSELFKKYYLPAIKEQLNRESPIWATLQHKGSPIWMEEK